MQLLSFDATPLICSLYFFRSAFAFIMYFNVLLNGCLLSVEKLLSELLPLLARALLTKSFFFKVFSPGFQVPLLLLIISKEEEQELMVTLVTMR